MPCSEPVDRGMEYHETCTDHSENQRNYNYVKLSRYFVQIILVKTFTSLGKSEEQNPDSKFSLLAVRVCLQWQLMRASFVSAANTIMIKLSDNAGLVHLPLLSWLRVRITRSYNITYPHDSLLV